MEDKINEKSLSEKILEMYGYIRDSINDTFVVLKYDEVIEISKDNPEIFLFFDTDNIEKFKELDFEGCLFKSDKMKRGRKPNYHSHLIMRRDVFEKQSEVLYDIVNKIYLLMSSFYLNEDIREIEAFEESYLNEMTIRNLKHKLLQSDIGDFTSRIGSLNKVFGQLFGGNVMSSFGQYFDNTDLTKTLSNYEDSYFEFFDEILIFTILMRTIVTQQYNEFLKIVKFVERCEPVFDLQKLIIKYGTKEHRSIYAQHILEK